VVRAIAELGRKGVLKQKRWKDGRQISNAHHLAWEKLQRKFLRFQQMVMEHHATRNAEEGSVKSGQRVVSASVRGSVKPDTQTNEGTNEGNQCPKGAHVPKVRDASVIISSEGKKEEGIQREPFTDTSIILGPPGGTIGPKPLDDSGTAWWSRQEARKLKALKTVTDPEKRKDLEAGLARAREHLRKATQ
jgi:hypothetical protein